MLIGLLAIGGVAFFVLARRVVKGAVELRALAPRAERVAMAALLLGGLAAPVRVLGGRFLPSLLGPARTPFDMIVAVGSVLALATVVAGVILVIVDVITLGTRRVGAGPAPPEGVTRRDFVRQVAAGGAFALGGGTALWCATGARWDVRLEEVPVRLARLPPVLDGVSIAQLSDVHAGLLTCDRELDEVVRMLRHARADLIVLTGDLVDHDPAFLPDVGRLARRIVEIDPRFGVFAVLGNHDYYAGADDVLDVLRRAGVRTLRNQGHRIVDGEHGFGIAGVDDVSAIRYAPGRAPDLARALAPLPRDDARILLCHDPVQFTGNAASIDLQLSGHTHGGQLLGGRFAEVVFPHGYIAGRYTRDDAQLYVNRGFGTAGPPLRGTVTPEVTRIILTAG